MTIIYLVLKLLSQHQGNHRLDSPPPPHHQRIFNLLRSQNVSPTCPSSVVSASFELWCWRRLLKSPFDSKEIKQVIPKGNQPRILIGRTDAEAEAPIFWPPDVKNLRAGKDPAAGKDRRQEKGVTEDEMVGWHHQLNGHEFEQALGVVDEQGSLACYSPWSHKESDTTE